VLLSYWLFAQRHHRIIATAVVVAGLVVFMIGMQQPRGSKLTSVGTGMELAGLIFLFTARGKVR
jgi:hypothetical protein